jgi:hypothetical protein
VPSTGSASVEGDFEALKADALATDALGDLVAHLFEPRFSRGRCILAVEEPNHRPPVLVLHQDHNAEDPGW